MVKKLIIILSALLFTTSSFAIRSFESVEIPNARCGDGSPYKVFIENKSSNRLAFKLQGGGACWSHFTCFTLGTARGKIPNKLQEDEGFSSDNKSLSPISNYSYVYFPYCTGDVHLGTHTAKYDGKRYNHNGRNNIELAVNYLLDNELIKPYQVDDFVLYGNSAGALGALYHINRIAPIFANAAKKTLILDAPGLHFGRGFWYNFTDKLFSDYGDALAKAGIEISKNKGLIAEVVPILCERNPDFEVGVLQTTEDRTMSWIFGEISAKDHARAVLGSNGIFELTKNPSDNCSAFIPSSNKHQMLNRNSKLGLRAGEKTAIDYAYELINYGSRENYKD